MRAVLDTSVLIGEPVEHPDLVAISSATLAELHFGVQLAASPAVRVDRVTRLAVIESRFEVLDIDARVARAYARLAARMAQLGRQPRRRTMDLLIAATAVAHEAVLLTRNAADLEGLSDIVTVVPVA